MASPKFGLKQWVPVPSALLYNLPAPAKLIYSLFLEHTVNSHICPSAFLLIRILLHLNQVSRMQWSLSTASPASHSKLQFLFSLLLTPIALKCLYHPFDRSSNLPPPPSSRWGKDGSLKATPDSLSKERQIGARQTKVTVLHYKEHSKIKHEHWGKSRAISLQWY